MGLPSTHSTENLARAAGDDGSIDVQYRPKIPALPQTIESSLRRSWAQLGITCPPSKIKEYDKTIILIGHLLLALLLFREKAGY
jgi:hypothetical protein